MTSPSAYPVSIFKWEDSSALEHSCWACGTKSNSPKALGTCYGIHSIPCMAYHSTMHAVGTSHRCAPCATSREMHDGRHRDIAMLVKEYHAADDDFNSPSGSGKRSFGARSRNARIQNVAQAEGDVSDHDGEINDNEDGVLAGSITTTTTSEKSVKLTKSEQRERKKTMKAQKSLEKAAKNEARHTIPITSEDVKRVERILHGDEASARTHPLATDTAIEEVIARSLKYVKQIEYHKNELRESVRCGRKEREDRKRVSKRASEGFQDAENEAVIDAILNKLGVDIIGSPGSTKGKGGNRPSLTPSKHRISLHKARIVLKLRDAVKDDMEKYENDLRQTYIRAGGFFRYAGKVVFERMTEIAKNIDLLTGEEWEKKREREAQLGLAQMVIEDVEDAGDVEENDD